MGEGSNIYYDFNTIKFESVFSVYYICHIIDYVIIEEIFIYWYWTFYILRRRYISWEGNPRFVIYNICKENSKYIFMTYLHNLEYHNNNSKYCKSFEIIPVIFVCIQLNKSYSMCNIWSVLLNWAHALVIQFLVNCHTNNLYQYMVTNPKTMLI